MHLTNLRNVGGSVMFAIPKAVLESLNMRSGSAVGISVLHGKLVVDPHPKPRYKLADLLAQCDATAPVSEEDAIWLNDAPIGREEI